MTEQYVTWMPIRGRMQGVTQEQLDNHIRELHNRQEMKVLWAALMDELLKYNNNYSFNYGDDDPQRGIKWTLATGIFVDIYREEYESKTLHEWRHAIRVKGRTSNYKAKTMRGDITNTPVDRLALKLHNKCQEFLSAMARDKRQGIADQKKVFRFKERVNREFEGLFAKDKEGKDDISAWSRQCEFILGVGIRVKTDSQKKYKASLSIEDMNANQTRRFNTLINNFVSEVRAENQEATRMERALEALREKEEAAFHETPNE